MLQATDLEWERCFKRIGTHTFSSSLGRPFGSNPVQHNTSNARSKLPEELPCTLTHSSAALTSLYTKKRKRAETNSTATKERLYFFFLIFFFPPGLIQKPSMLFTGSVPEHQQCSCKELMSSTGTLTRVRSGMLSMNWESFLHLSDIFTTITGHG